MKLVRITEFGERERERVPFGRDTILICVDFVLKHTVIKDYSDVYNAL